MRSIPFECRNIGILKQLENEKVFSCVKSFTLNWVSGFQAEKS